MDLRSSPALSLRQLQYIVAVADLGGFRRAADACHVAQPSLSAQIAQVERQLGLTLFERDRRRVRVPPVARAVIDQARAVLVAAHDLVDLARRHANPFDGTLRLGVIPTVAPYLLPEVMPGLSRAFPRLTVLWTEARTIRLVDELRERVLDAALLAIEADVGDLDYEVVTWDPFVLAAAPDHPLVQGADPATLDVLSDGQVLLLDDGHCLRDQALAVCERSGAREESFRATSLATLVQVVSSTQCVTLLPSLALAVENRRAQIRTRPFAAPQPGRTLALAWRKRSSLAPALAAVAAVFRQRIDQSGRPSVTNARKRAGRSSPRSRRSGASANS
jgi:LysR family transcriptional regulator, hydrogen peroxide-inducible genes activator